MGWKQGKVAIVRLVIKIQHMRPKGSKIVRNPVRR